MPKCQSVLIVEDELISAEYLKTMIEKEGYEVLSIVETGKAAIEQCKLFNPDLVLMDIMLKEQMSGCEAALQIKQHNQNISIIFLSAFADPEMVDYAVDSEASGYLMKPYREEEILATVRLACSRHHKENPHNEIIFLKDGYAYHTDTNRLTKDDEEVPLSEKPLKLIEILAKNKNRSISNEQICTFIWGKEQCDCTLRSLIHRVRHTIGSDMIKNINGMGYEMIV